MSLDQGCIDVTTYEVKFLSFSRYAMQLVTIEEERICLFIKGINSEFFVLFDHMNSEGKIFNEVTNLVKKVKEVRQDCQTKALAKKSKISRNFEESYQRGSG